MFRFFADSVVNGLALNKANRVTCQLAGRLSPTFHLTHNGIDYVFACPNPLTRWRAETFADKEPETLEWIDTFQKGATLFDIGANVGIYAIYAAKRGINVMAFEPESQNYALINKNVYLNGVADRVKCLSVALSDCDGIDYLYIPEFQAGGALNNFGSAIDLNHQEFSPAFKQGGLSYSLDSFVQKYTESFPNHIKIDVDGIEFAIVRGAEKTLRDLRLRSLSIELNEVLPESPAIQTFIEGTGLKFVQKKHAAMFDDTQYKQIFNYVFGR
ncbi:MAG: FkbM family methyltransferase [Deltaproteobacteria bacterium]|nr:FkbM family methyltransferase [Deltaproteobacteria bacterium]MBI3294162.1 FkbM family methyltransferase [Deltaproteobacteria bacterium]